jgi:hypothetical protein
MKSTKHEMKLMIRSSSIFVKLKRRLNDLYQGKRPEMRPNKFMIPLTNYGVKCISSGFLVPDDLAYVWRGPMVHRSLAFLLTLAFSLSLLSLSLTLLFSLLSHFLDRIVSY